MRATLCSTTCRTPCSNGVVRYGAAYTAIAAANAASRHLQALRALNPLRISRIVQLVGSEVAGGVHQAAAAVLQLPV